jgi:hypothetical protein
VQHVHWTAVNKTTTSTSDVSIVSYSLPANTLDRDGAGVIIRASGILPSGTFTVKFGSTTLFTLTQAVSGQGYDNFYIEATVLRRASSSQRASVTINQYDPAFASAPPNVASIFHTSPTQDQTLATTIDFRCDQIGAGTVILQTASIQSVDPGSTSVN